CGDGTTHAGRWCGRHGCSGGLCGRSRDHGLCRGGLPRGGRPRGRRGRSGTEREFLFTLPEGPRVVAATDHLVFPPPLSHCVAYPFSDRGRDTSRGGVFA